MEQNTTQEKIQMLQERMTGKIELIASFLNNGMTDLAMIELGALQEYMDLQFKTMVESMPGKLI